MVVVVADVVVVEHGIVVDYVAEVVPLDVVEVSPRPSLYVQLFCCCWIERSP